MRIENDEFEQQSHKEHKKERRDKLTSSKKIKMENVAG